MHKPNVHVMSRLVLKSATTHNICTYMICKDLSAICIYVYMLIIRDTCILYSSYITIIIVVRCTRVQLLCSASLTLYRYRHVLKLNL